MSRDPPPPLPGGYTVGEKVFFTGANETVSTGDKIVHGQQGEVTGPATLETLKGKGVAVRFPGNKGNIECYLNTVRRLRAASAATRPYALHTRRCMRTPRAAVPPRPDPSCKLLLRRQCRSGSDLSSPALLMVNARR